ncbi:MAG TPA: KUP/HAK/KT family potassium transporter [Ideonella sp.]|nr:KUP/HAK/KT family potassium transporter [Ideonella sp.]
MLLDRVPREPGVGVFIGMEGEIDVNAFVRFLAAKKRLPQTVVFLTTEVELVPSIPLAQQAQVAELGQGMLRVVVRLGFNDEPDIPQALRAAQQLDLDEAAMRYYIRKDSMDGNPPRGIARWRSWLLKAMSRASRPACEHLRLPISRVTQVPMA